MRLHRGWLGVPVVLVLTSCGGDDGGMQASPADQVQAPIAVTPPVMTPGTLIQTTQLTPLSSSGVRGEVVVRDRDEFTTEVTVRLSGASANAPHAGHLHSGTCNEIGPVVQPLEAITPASDGRGEVTFTLQRAPMTLLDGLHIAVYHDPAGAPAACGLIGAHTM